MSAISHKYFKKEDVNVKFKTPTDTIDVIRLTMPDKSLLPTVKGGFHFFRLVINLKLVDIVHTKNNVMKFTDPFELQVRYLQGDLDMLNQDEELHLAYWDGAQWVRFTDPKYNERLDKWDPVAQKGLIIVDIDTWIDPPIAIGT